MDASSILIRWMCTLSPDLVAGDRGYLAPLRRGLLLCPETARIGRQHSPRARGWM